MDQLDLQFAQFPIGDDQEIAATAGRIEELHLAQPLLKGSQFGAAFSLARPQTVEFRSQIVEKQWPDHLHNVLLGDVVGALGAALGGFHHGLEERPEDGGRDGLPVEAAGVDQRRPHLSVEIGNDKPCREQIAVDIGEAGEARIAKARQQVQTELDRFRSGYPTQLAFPYKLEKKAAGWPFLVEAMWHDGRFTYLRSRAQEAPALYELKDGKPSLVAYDLTPDDLYIARHLLSDGWLQIGSKKARWRFDPKGAGR